MANNVISGPNALIALDDHDLATLPLNDANTAILYEVNGAYKSWKPNAPINAVTALVKNRGYLLIAKQGMDLTAYFAPPLPEGGGGNAVVGVDGATIEMYK